MKVGDTLICKRRIFEVYPVIIENDKYQINQIYENYITINTLCGEFFFKSFEKYKSEMRYLYDYFYSQEELRSLKLNSI